MQTIVREVAERVARVTIDNPPVNALSIETTRELLGAFESLAGAAETGGVRAVVVAARESKGVFVAGADINLFKKLRVRADGVELAAFYHAALNRIAEFPVPVICAIDGLALGGGAELALACDIRVAGEKAVFALPEVQRGVLPGGGGTQRLSRLVGPGRAKELILSGRRVDAREACAIGLVERLAGDGKAFDEALILARTIAQNGPTAVRSAKKAIDRGLDLPLREGLLLEKEALGDVCESGEPREGATAFFEKRPPRF